VIEMRREEEATVRQAGDHVLLRDVVSSMAVCATFDPGQDDTPDPDEYPPNAQEHPSNGR
jgi:hypothetical protein